MRSLAARRPPLLPALPGATGSSRGGRDLRGHVFRAQRFRFSEEPGLGAEGAVLEVRVPQVRAAAPARRPSGPCALAWERLSVPREEGQSGVSGSGVRPPALGWTRERKVWGGAFGM